MSQDIDTAPMLHLSHGDTLPLPQTHAKGLSRSSFDDHVYQADRQTNELSLSHPQNSSYCTLSYAKPLHMEQWHCQTGTHNDSHMVNSSLNTSIGGMVLEEQPKIKKDNSKAEKRDVIVKWLALIHTKYWFEQETLHLSVSIIDRFLKVQGGVEVDFELLGVTAFWVAAKIEERKIKDLRVWMKLGRKFHREEIIEMESRIMQVLDYQLIDTTSQNVLWELLTNFTTSNQKSIHLCLYLLQLSLLNGKYSVCDPAIIALSCIYLSSKIQSCQQSDSTLHHLFLHNWEDIRRCSRKLCRTVQKASKDPKCPIVRKYASRKFSEVSCMRFGKKQYSEEEASTGASVY